jgi:poly-beta-hydroxybutyrate-responsive repressor
MRHGRHPRARRFHGGRWRVQARVERFVEPALLLLLREQPAHGYELLERLPEVTGPQPVEMGNLYRLLRGLEEEGLVSSEWDAASAGPAKRRYTLTPAGGALLDQWADALREAQQRSADFLERYERGRG